jgi:hypothetical protein
MLFQQNRNLVVGEVGKLPIGDVDGRGLRDVLD